MDARNYRERLYHERAHPKYQSEVSGQSDDSFFYLYASIIPFLVLEYFTEIRVDSIPPGAVFPAGFLIFWAFYFTYCQPDFLENRLHGDKKWDLIGIPGVILSSCIWFVKTIVVELVGKILCGIFRVEVSPKSHKPNQESFRNRTTHSKPYIRLEPTPQSASQPAPHIEKRELPREIINALQILGLKETREWILIQKRYRELAKKHHPDLNQEITQAGNRFMMYDAAYRKLETVKNVFFKS